MSKKKNENSSLGKTALKTRPPIVTVMGHIDHGKTTLLDYIRKTKVTQKEHGGITQAIGAYRAEIKTKEGTRQITFIDTPGHAAFEKMRSRGAHVADIVILIIAAQDGVMPQTVEAIKHIKSAAVPMIVAINKIDVSSANIDRVKQQLAENEVFVEGYGGDTVCLPISAKTGEGVQALLEMILLISEMEELKGDGQKKASGVVIESHKDTHQGPVATVLVRDGTLKVGEEIQAGDVRGKVRVLVTDRGERISQAGPSMPVQVFGFSTLPSVGARLFEKEETKKEEKPGGFPLSLEEKHELKLILKADTRGSLEAIYDSLQKLKSGEFKVNILSREIGDISESDIILAKSMGAKILGFNVRYSPDVQRSAREAKVEVFNYQIIYKLLEDIEKELGDLARPKVTEEILGKAQIIAEFTKDKQKIAGSKVLEGTLLRGEKIRLIREGNVLAEARIKSLKHLAKDIARAKEGTECGLVFDTDLDFAIGDVIECYRQI